MTLKCRWLTPHEENVTLALPHFGGHAGHLIRWHWGLKPPPHHEVRPFNPLCFCPDAGLISWEECNGSVPHLLHLLSERTTQYTYSSEYTAPVKEGVSSKNAKQAKTKFALQRRNTCLEAGQESHGREGWANTAASPYSPDRLHCGFSLHLWKHKAQVFMMLYTCIV